MSAGSKTRANLSDNITSQTRYVTVAFFCCWIPRQSVILLNITLPSVVHNHSHIVNMITKLTVLVAFSNVAFVPMAYCRVTFLDTME